MSSALPPDDESAERARRLHAMFHDRLADLIARHKFWNTLVLLFLGFSLATVADDTWLGRWNVAAGLAVGALPALLPFIAAFSDRLHRRLFLPAAVFAGGLILTGGWVVEITTRAQWVEPWRFGFLLALFGLVLLGLYTALRQVQLELRHWFERGPANAYDTAPPTPGWARALCSLHFGLWALAIAAHQLIAARAHGSAAGLYETIPGLLATFTGLVVLWLGLWGPFAPLKLLSIGAAGMSALWIFWFDLLFWLPAPGAMPTLALTDCCRHHGSPIARYTMLLTTLLVAGATQPAAVKLLRATLRDLQAARGAAGPPATPADEAITTEHWDEAPPT